MIKITKFSDKCNPDILIRNTIKEKYGICPFCKKNYDYWKEETWFGKHDEHDCFTFYSCFSPDRTSYKISKRLRFWEKDHEWAIIKFRCECGAQWESEPYRIDNMEEALEELYREQRW